MTQESHEVAAATLANLSDKNATSIEAKKDNVNEEEEIDQKDLSKKCENGYTEVSTNARFFVAFVSLPREITEGMKELLSYEYVAIIKNSHHALFPVRHIMCFRFSLRDFVRRSKILRRPKEKRL